MKQKRSIIAVSAGIAVLALVSFAAMGWDFKDTAYHFAGSDRYQTDTVPGKTKAKEKKIRDLDDALAELERAQAEMDTHLKLDMEKMQKELAAAMKELDVEKIRMEVEKSLMAVDMQKIEKEIKEALSKADEELAKIDMEKIRKEIKESLAEVDLGKMKKDIEKVKEMDFSKMELELAKARKEIEGINPKIELELQKVKEDIEKIKKELEEFKEFVDGLDRDGLIDKKNEYSIELKKGKLIINGKEQPQEIYNKYKKYLEGKKDFKIEKSANDFNVDFDNDGVIRI